MNPAADEIDASQPQRLRFSLAAAGAGLLAATVLPGASGPGVGIPLVALAVSAAVALLCASDLTPHMIVFSLLSLLLTFVAMFRAAEWVVVLDLLFAVALSSYALAGGATWWSTVRGLIGAGSRLHLAPGFLLGPLGGKMSRGSTGLGPMVRGAVLGGVLLLIFGGLFLAADTAFAQIAANVVDGALPHLGTLPARLFTGLGITLFAASLVLAGPRFAPTGPLWRGDLASAFRKVRDGGVRERGGPSRWEWLIPLLALDLLFAAFVTVQIAVLFGGRGHVLRTAGLTYAEYARSGFFQLVAVAALTLLVVAAVRAWVGAGASAYDKRLVRVLLAVLCILTLVVLASALRRIGLYEDAFGLTRLRLFVHGVILWLGAIFALVLVAGAARGSWLPRSLVAMTAAALIIFTLIDPDATIARRNVDRYEATGAIDLCFLGTLSADAVPALQQLPQDLAASATAGLRRDLARPDPWFAWNWGRERARDALGPAAGPSRSRRCYDL